MSVRADKPPAAMNPPVPKVLGNGPLADFMDLVDGETRFIKLESSKVRREVDDSPRSHQSDDAGKKSDMVSLNIPVLLGPLAVRERRGIDHG